MAITVELWVAPVPLPNPIFTPAGTFDIYHHLVVLASDGDGNTGWGLAAGVTSTDLDEVVERAEKLLDAAGATVNGLLTVESVDAAGTACPSGSFSRWAACALSTAGWDLFARQSGVRCADLWAQSKVPDDLDCYASGLFLGSSDDDLVAEARAYRDDGYTKVKMRTGTLVEHDLARLELVTAVFPEPGSVAVDSVNGWNVDQTRQFLAASGPLLWVEDPVPLSDIGELTDSTALVAAGESLTSLEALRDLHETGAVGAILLDVQQVGGPARFLDAARELGSAGAKIGAHIFTHVSAHLLAGIDDPLPLEIFDWSDALCSAPLRPGPSGRVAIRGPGFGMQPDRAALEHYGHRVL